MVTLETSFKLLNKLIGRKLSINELEEILFNLGLELDEINNDEIKIDITPDRPDMVSPQGLARALRVYLGSKNPEYKVKKSDFKVIIDKSVKEVRPYTACAVIKNLKFNEEKIKEIIWVQEKLHQTFGRNRQKVAMGIYPMEKIKFPIKYLAKDPKKIKFRPLEAHKDLTGLQILSEHPTGKEYGHLLEGKKKFPIFVDANNQILSMPPIINSHETGKIDIKTKDIFIECSGFDFEALSKTLNILVYLFQDLGGEIYQVQLNYSNKKIITPLLNKEKREIKIDYIEKIIGIKLGSSECAKNLKKMMYEVIKTNKDKITFNVPPIRTDIWHDVDIVDDIVRGYGVNKIPCVLPEVATDGDLLFENRIKKQIIEILTGLGFHEVINFGLTDKEDQFTKMNIKEKDHIKLGNTTEQSINMIRTWLTPELLKTLHYNRSVTLPHKIFEVDYVVLPNKSKDVLSENILRLAGSISDTDADFTKIKQVLVNVIETLGFSEYKFEDIKHDSFITGRTAKIIINKKEVGILGEINPLVLNNWELKNPTSCFELNLYKLFDIKNNF